MRRLLILLVLLSSVCATAQKPPGSFRDDLLNQLVGDWNATGAVHGNPSHQQLTGEWVLGHQFFRLSQRSAERSLATDAPYEGVFYIGWDELQNLYVAHLMNVFGGRDSETLGYGQHNGNEIQLVFKSDEGSVIERFTWEPNSKTWRVLSMLDSPDAKPLLELTLRHAR